MTRGVYDPFIFPSKQRRRICDLFFRRTPLQYMLRYRHCLKLRDSRDLNGFKHPRRIW